MLFNSAPTRPRRVGVPLFFCWAALLATACNSNPTPIRQRAEVVSAEPEAPAAPSPSSPSPVATPPEEPRPPRELRGAAAAALRAGRRFAAAGEHVRALSRFRAGLAIEGSETTDAHASLLCGAGWSSFHTEDPAAETLLQQGYAAHTRHAGRAACAYRLGRLFERRAEQGERGDAMAARGEAIKWYARSLALRPESDATRQRYEALTESTFRASCGPLGAFTSLDLFCANASRQLDRSGEIESCERLPLASEGDGVGELALMAVQTDEWAWTNYYLLVRRGPMWHRLSMLGESFDRGCAKAGFEAHGARWSADDRPGRLPRLEVVARASASECPPSPWERCMRGESRERDCDPLSDDVEVNEFGRGVRVVCAEDEGRYRCTLGSLAMDVPRPHELLGAGALPDDISDDLVCSVFPTGR